MLTKQCSGSFDDEIRNLLETNDGRAQWSTYRCSVCGQPVGGERKAGQWVPEPHWASISYAALERKRPVRKYA